MLLAAAIIITSCDDDDDEDISPNQTDTNFMTMAAYANMNEVDFAQMALTKSTHDSVKVFANMMIADHTLAMDQLDSIADNFNYNLPTTIDSIHAALKTQLMALDGYEFDTAYMNSQVRDHINAITLFQNEVNQGRNPSIRNYASDKLPHLQMHKQRADSIRAHLQ
jgi:putative membrane protein